MATQIPIRPRKLFRSSQSYYAIVESQYNTDYVRPMADAVVKELQEMDAGVIVERVEAPGAFEIPLLVKALLERKRYHAVIALGVIFKGETDHADLIAKSTTDSLQRLSLEYLVPVIHEVLLLNNEEQAKVRCLGEKLNRGVEAARAAYGAAHVMEELQASR